ncbi:heparan sulfate glucosamine 3-O-sulfotransferase 3B1 [Elysia marginata]|uniref:Heparan sulfate glucosamine 3-O-sulfotransferase 3B1 n=1 Tax=Elysia marginata TaxID=1093978 RepID=A0AAV4JZD2_9GAST|nr:heparan sulfate glucosamine 3-O-sulfotransferase 3B1 [Elysia marginata]
MPQLARDILLSLSARKVHREKMQNRIVKLFLLISAWTVVLAILLIASHRFGHRAINSQQLLRSFSELTPDMQNNRSSSSSSSNDRNIRKSVLGNVKNERKPRLPNCLIIGFSKCGTLALRGFLSLHPDIVSTLREIRYFTLFYKKGVEWYRNQMPPSKEGQVTIEKTPSYILDPEAIERIHEYNSSIKLIIIVRDPITRLQSIYSHTFSDDPKSLKNPTFKEWCDENLRRGQRVMHVANYAPHIEQVYKLFPKENVLVLSEEDLEENPMRVMREAEEFLGLKPSFSKDDFVYSKEKGFYCFNTSSPHYPEILESVVLNRKTGCLGSGKGREHPDIDEKFLKQLVEVIRPFNVRLFKLIGKKFSWENFKDSLR